jgi:hypothetical protein
MAWIDRIADACSARPARALAGAAMATSLLLAGGSLLGPRPAVGVPAWAWLSLAFVCLIVREAQQAVRAEASRRARAGRRVGTTARVREGPGVRTGRRPR